MERWPGPFSFENRNLLAKGEDLKSGIGSAAEEHANQGDEGEDEFDHEITVVAEGRPVTAPGGGTTQPLHFARGHGGVIGPGVGQSSACNDAGKTGRATDATSSKE